MERLLSPEQSDVLSSLKKVLSSYNGEIYDGSVMQEVLDSVVYRYEDRGFRTFDLNDLQKRRSDLQEHYDELSKRMQESIENDSSDRSRIEELELDLTKIVRQIRVLEGLIDSGGKEMLLGTYHYDVQLKSGVITLFLENINDASKVLVRRFGSNAGVYLLQYVFVHEVFHAYFDVCHNDKIREIEEAMAEYASLCFLSGYNKNVFSLAEYEIKEKKNSPIWTSAYGFGEYIFKKDKSKKLIGTYRNANGAILPSDRKVKQFSKRFNSGYPWRQESAAYNDLLKILNLPQVKGAHKSRGSKSDAKDLVDTIVAIANRQVDIIIKNATIVFRQYFNSLNLSPADLNEKRYSDLLDIHTKLQNGSSLDEYDALKLLFPRYLIVRGRIVKGKYGKANVIYSQQEKSSQQDNYKLTEASINHKVYYIISQPDCWRGTNGNHRDDFISHIDKLTKIKDSNGRTLFFDYTDRLNIEAAFRKIIRKIPSTFYNRLSNCR